MNYGKIGYLAHRYCDRKLPLVVCRSAAGYYIGTFSNTLGPISRESAEYYATEAEAEEALKSQTWTQREQP